MSVISNVIFIVLFIVNLLATLYSCVVVDTIYDTDACLEELISASYDGVYGVILLLTLKLAEYNINLAVLLTVVTIIANILVAKLAIKIDYKRNVKPYLQIKF